MQLVYTFLLADQRCPSDVILKQSLLSLTEARADRTQPEPRVQDGTNPRRHLSTEELVPKGHSTAIFYSPPCWYVGRAEGERMGEWAIKPCHLRQIV